MEGIGRQSLPAEVEQVLKLLRQTLGESLIVAYVYGSAVAGGLRPHSDIDVLAVVSNPTTHVVRQRLVTGLMDISGREAKHGSARPVEVTVVVLDDVTPWRYPPRCDLQYGEWLRDEFARGEIPAPRDDPDLTILLHNVLQQSVVLAGPPAAQLFDPALSDDLGRAIIDLLPEIVGGWKGDERNTLLTLARMWLTLATGDILPKDVAARRLMGQLPNGLRPVLQLAATEYLGQRQIDWEGHSSDVGAFVAHVGAMIAALSPP